MRNKHQGGLDLPLEVTPPLVIKSVLLGQHGIRFTGLST